VLERNRAKMRGPKERERERERERGIEERGKGPRE
jgi:hypothetical protein